MIHTFVPTTLLRFFFYFLFLSSALPMAAMNSLVLAPEDSNRIQAKIIFMLDSRSTLIQQNAARIFGIRWGAEIEQFRFGMGLYSLSSDIGKWTLRTNSVGVIDSVYHRFHMAYTVGFLEYVVLRTKRWELSPMIALGPGNASVSLRRAGADPTLGNVGLIIFEPSLSGHFRIIKYAGIGAGLGYRLTISNDREVNRSLTSTIYILKLKVFLGDIYRDMQKNCKKKKALKDVKRRS